jgi:hypothetical protein
MCFSFELNQLTDLILNATRKGKQQTWFGSQHLEVGNANRGQMATFPTDASLWNLIFKALSSFCTHMVLF